VASATLALSASLVWGVADFVGGILVRRYAVLAVMAISHGAGLAVLAAIALADGAPLDRETVQLGLVAGIVGAVSLGAFYQATALGLISIASPLLAGGAVLAFGLAVAAGERPSMAGAVGATLVVAGVVLASLGEHAAAGGRRKALPYALAAPVALGFYMYLLGRASEAGGSVHAVLTSRISSVGLLVVLAVVLRPSFRADAGVLAATGIMGIVMAGSLVLFGLAAETGLISIAAILASASPIVTVLLARTFLGERLHGRQLAGVTLVLAGLFVVAAR
jgi:drug/metabolite transporter (DMT)-like permease